MFPTFASFDECMKACTSDHEAMVLDQTSLSYNISDCVYFYKATPDLKYRLGDAEYCRYSSRKKVAENESSDDEENARPRRRVRVKKRYPAKKNPE